MITGFILVTPDRLSVSSFLPAAPPMSLSPCFQQAAIQPGHMEGCAFNSLCCLCVCAFNLTLTQLPKLRCLSSMQKVRIVRMAVCCGYEERQTDRQIMSQCCQLKLIQIAVFKYASATIQTYNINNLTALQGSICCIEPIKTKKKVRANGKH